MEWNHSRGAGINPALAALEEVQRRALKAPGTEWWSRPFLFSASKIPRKVFEGALDTIRKREAPGWFYKRAGREAAYCLERFTQLLPDRLRPAPEEKAALLDGSLRQHVLDTIDTAEREYHAAPDRVRLPPEEDGINSLAVARVMEDARGAAIAPHYTHVLELAKSGRLRVPKRILPIDSKDWKDNTEAEAMNLPGVGEMIAQLAPEWRMAFLLNVRVALLTPEASPAETRDPRRNRAPAKRPARPLSRRGSR